jgi:ATP-dependent Clp protease ATP-binding subunit ClpB
VQRILQAHFRPEFLNRIDEIIVFHTLSRGDLSRIVEIQLRHLITRIAGKGFILEVSDNARLWLADNGYDPDYGARPLKRTIQRELQDPLALSILSGRFKPGETILVDVAADRLTFSSVVLGEVVN